MLSRIALADHFRLQEMSGTGYGDRDLSFVCHKCVGEVNHDLLRVAKFRKETENLIMRDWPLGGTIISTTTGGPDAPTQTDISQHFNTFPNRLVGKALRTQVLELTAPNRYNRPTMTHVRDLIEQGIKNKSIVKQVNNRTPIDSGNLRRQERLAIRKMMSRYWENSSIFALELGGAVIRQNVFVDKMYGLDWLHSPAAKETMSRLLVKYERFVQIMAAYPLHVAVPTLDVDLGWHTHQLSPKSYYDYTNLKCKKFIDHDDKMDEDALNTGFEWTSKTYQKLFQGVYSECTCWYCEGKYSTLNFEHLLTETAIRSKHISTAGKIFGTSTHEKVLDKFYDSGAAKLCPPDNSAHISAHSAVKVAESETRAKVYDVMRKRRQQELDTAYQKACKRARAKNRPVPTRDAYYNGPWGYPYMMYGPWMAYGYYPGIYAYGNPYFMPIGVGMYGACAQGTCSGGVAAGGCGGPGGCGTGGGCVSIFSLKRLRSCTTLTFLTGWRWHEWRMRWRWRRRRRRVWRRWRMRRRRWMWRWWGLNVATTYDMIPLVSYSLLSSRCPSFFQESCINEEYLSILIFLSLNHRKCCLNCNDF